MAFVKKFAPQELEILAIYLTPRNYEKGESLFREGDSGNDLFLLRRGSVSVKIWLPQNGRRKRLRTILVYFMANIFVEIILVSSKTKVKK